MGQRSILTRHPTVLVFLLLCIHQVCVLGIHTVLVSTKLQVSTRWIVALFAALPAIWFQGRVLFGYPVHIIRFVKGVPVFISRALGFIATGRNEWSLTLKIGNHDYFYWSRRRCFGECLSKGTSRFLDQPVLTTPFRLVLVGSFAFAYFGGHAPLIMFSMLPGSTPNNRNEINGPHSNWLLYSVCCELVSLA